MSRLEELEEDLYGKDADRQGSRRKRSFPLVRAVRDVRTAWEDKPGSGAAGGKGGHLKRWMIFLIIGAVFFAAGGVLFVFWYLGGDRREAEIVIAGRDFVEAGEPVTIPVIVKNISARPLEDAELAIDLPDGAAASSGSVRERGGKPRVIAHLGTLDPGEEHTEEVSFQLFGREGEEKEITATLLYRPERLRARFSSQGSDTITIRRVPLELFWDVPETVSPRQRTEMTLRYSLQGRVPFEDVWLFIEYPPGFSLADADPKPAVGESFWNIGKLEPGKEGRIALSGSFDGIGGDTKTIRAGLGFFDELTKEWKPWRESAHEVELTASPFALITTVQGKRDGVIRPGEQAEVVVRYENKSGIAIKNVSVRAVVEGAIADLASVTADSGGVFDAGRQAIVWGPGGTPELREVKLGQGGEFRFIVATRPRPVMRSIDDKNLTLRVRASLEAPDLPRELQGVNLSPDDLVELKVATIVLFSGRAVFRSSPILNTGPLPPKVGEKTTYTIIWDARNFTNEIENAELRASLPPNIRWEGVISPQDARVSYDVASAEVRWRIGRISPGAGVLTSGLTAAFQVSITPAVADIGKPLLLASEARFTGRDVFTGEEITGKLDAFTTELRDDPTSTDREWRVAP